MFWHIWPSASVINTRGKHFALNSSYFSCIPIYALLYPLLMGRFPCLLHCAHKSSICICFSVIVKVNSGPLELDDFIGHSKSNNKK
jgi:hypothetical protein